jgi:hypothetical protein
MNLQAPQSLLERVLSALDQAGIRDKRRVKVWVDTDRHVCILPSASLGVEPISKALREAGLKHLEKRGYRFDLVDEDNPPGDVRGADPLTLANARIDYWRTAFEVSQAGHNLADAEREGTDEAHNQAIAEYEETEREHEKAKAALQALGVEP